MEAFGLFDSCLMWSLLFLQTEQAVRPKYLAGKEVTGNMRAILIDWLVQVQIKFRLLQETMYMTVAIIDRFLQVGAVPVIASGCHKTCFKGMVHPLCFK